MSRCIVVLSVGRSGSSAVAGMLHKMGVDMGAYFMAADRNNPYGTYEDANILKANRMVAAGKVGPSIYESVVRNRLSLWGFKDPMTCYTLPYILPYLDDVRIVSVMRDPDAAVASFARAYGASKERAQEWFRKTHAAFQNSLDEFEGYIMPLYFEDILKDPQPIARRLGEFVTDGLDDAPGMDIEAAAAHIRQEPDKEAAAGLPVLHGLINRQAAGA